MATTVWKGYIAFGLVSIPVRLFRAARAERVPLRQLYRPPRPSSTDRWTAVQPAVAPEFASRSATAAAPDYEQEAEQVPEQAEVAPVRRVYERAGTSDDSTAVPAADLVKGYEYEKGQYVVVDEQDLRSLAPKTTTEMQIAEFVHLNEVDPVYLETSYYLVPEESGEKAYALLFEAMRDTGYAAIGQVVMHRRDHVVILRPGKTGLLAHTMFYPDEVRSIQEFRTDTSLVASKELELAKSFIQALTTSFDPSKFKNNFQERLRQLIESRVAGQQITPLEATKAAKVVDIMDALRRSLAQVAPSPESQTAAKKPARSERTAGRQRTASAEKKRRTS